MEQRQGLIHEGTGERVTTASVEIVFDNSDHRIVAVEGTEVRVLRRISLKKDQYFIDMKMVSRSDVVNLMESAGFSRSNPYYIVKQGKINELATDADSRRLKLLREVAGTRVYDERKEESLKILRETNAKSEKIEALLTYMDERLKTLEEEKEDLKEYQKWDKMKRSIEYVIYDNEVKEARRKLDKLAEQREELNTRQSKTTDEMLDVQKKTLNATTDLRKLEARYKGMLDEKKVLMDEQNQRFEKKTKLELLIKDLREDVEKERSGRNSAEDKLQQLKNDISGKQKELEEITPGYHSLTEEAARLNTDIRILEQRYKELYAKQGYMDQYRTIEERDKALSKEVRFYDRQLAGIDEQIRGIERNMEEEEAEEQDLNAKITEFGIQAEECVDQMSTLNLKMAEARRRLDEAAVLQQEAARNEKNARDSLDAIKIEILQAEQDFKRLVPRSLMNGMESVRRVMQFFEENNHNGQYSNILNGYRGRVIDLFNCKETYYQAVEVTIGNRLFYQVVDDDRIAMKIIREVNNQRLMGEVNFFPLNRIISNPKKETNDPEARPILDNLNYDPKFDVVFTHIFGGTAIVRTMAAGNRLAKREGFDCVTFEGDQVSRRGEMTGGYLDAKRSRLETYSLVRNLMEQKIQLEQELDVAVLKNNEAMAYMENIRNDGESLERDAFMLKEKHMNAAERRRYLLQQVQQLNKNREPKLAQCMVLRNRIREMQANREDLQKQLGTPLLSQLSPDEQRSLHELQTEIEEKKIKLEEMNREKTKLELTKSRLENHLLTNLIRKQENLQAKIHDISVDEKRNNLQAEMTELKVVNDRLSEVMKRLADLEKHLVNFEIEEERLTRSLEDFQEEQKDLEAQVTEFSKQVDLICTKQSAMQAKREDIMKKIRELGSLPMDVKNYESLSSKQLNTKLDEALEKLKKYENVNKKALDQFIQASSQKEELTKRMEEHKASLTSISDLLKTLEERKYEAIQLTFKQVSKNFQNVFEKLVPGGYGTLVMRAMNKDEHPHVENLPIAETFTGIGIRVSFSGAHETREMQQLSGGQKSLVALALIFSIQKCDPAPFYLFDEIDAALDAQHRKAVADMIHELSENAQFITTTFRPELLECAEKYFGVHFRNKVSYIDVVTKEQAYDFVEDDQTHG